MVAESTSQAAAVRGSSTRAGIIRRNTAAPFVPLPRGHTPVWSPDRPPITPPSQPVPLVKLGSLFLEKYEVTDLIGEGGFAQVYRVRDTVKGKNLALKVIFYNPEGVQLELEGETTRLLSEELESPHLVGFFGAGVCQTPSGPADYLLLEYIDGPTLKDRIKKEKSLTLPEALEITFSLASVLMLAYNKLGLCNHDVKPENVMFRSNNVPVLLDWGLARFRPDEGAYAGSPTFLAPERFTSSENDPRSDMYSLGITLYCMITGRSPFFSSTEQLLNLMEEKNQKLRDIPGLPEPAQKLIDRMTAPDINERFESYEALRAEIESVRKQLAEAKLDFLTLQQEITSALDRADAEDNTPTKFKRVDNTPTRYQKAGTARRAFLAIKYGFLSFLDRINGIKFSLFGKKNVPPANQNA